MAFRLNHEKRRKMRSCVQNQCRLEIAALKKTASEKGFPPNAKKGAGAPSISKSTPWGDAEKGSIPHGRDSLPSHGLHRSTIGDGGLNCRVRNGTG